MREVWDAWVARLPSFYNPGLEVTVDEQLVPFRGKSFFSVFFLLLLCYVDSGC